MRLIFYNKSRHKEKTDDNIQTPVDRIRINKVRQVLCVDQLENSRTDNEYGSNYSDQVHRLSESNEA